MITQHNNMAQGSPPRMRGKVQPDADGCRPPGITPAYAGKRDDTPSITHLRGDHPRVCGEKDAICKSCPARQGSPPRMRGKARQAVYKDIKHGITPAYAGKRRQLILLASPCQDHPRVCGEKLQMQSLGDGQSVSPPRMRGKVPLGYKDCLHDRITPAYAGKSAV